MDLPAAIQIPSRTDPSREYLVVPTPVAGGMIWRCCCPSWGFRGRCHHSEEAQRHYIISQQVPGLRYRAQRLATMLQNLSNRFECADDEQLDRAVSALDRVESAIMSLTHCRPGAEPERVSKNWGTTHFTEFEV
jgi:hypothetical protein